MAVVVVVVVARGAGVIVVDVRAEGGRLGTRGGFGRAVGDQHAVLRRDRRDMPGHNKRPARPSFSDTVGSVCDCEWQSSTIVNRYR